jgi:hypothetical protein
MTVSLTADRKTLSDNLVLSYGSRGISYHVPNIKLIHIIANLNGKHITKFIMLHLLSLANVINSKYKYIYM